MRIIFRGFDVLMSTTSTPNMSLQLLRMFENETSLIFETEKKFELFFRFVIEVGEPALKIPRELLNDDST